MERTSFLFSPEKPGPSPQCGIFDGPGQRLAYKLSEGVPPFWRRSNQINVMNATNRLKIEPGLHVLIVLKQDQRSGKLTKGKVKDVLTKSPTHPHGIKVRLESGEVGRVKEILE